MRHLEHSYHHGISSLTRPAGLVRRKVGRYDVLSWLDEDGRVIATGWFWDEIDEKGKPPYTTHYLVGQEVEGER